MVEDNWKGVFSSRVERLLEKVIKPDAIFSIDNKPFILFFDSPENKKKKLKILNEWKKQGRQKAKKTERKTGRNK